MDTLSTAKGIVAITGGSSGIGRATAIHFAQQGWSVGLIARGAAGLSAGRSEVEATGRRGAYATADVADPEQVEQAAASIEAQLGPVDVWVNCAGISFYGKFLDITEEEFRRITEVTYLGVVNGTRVALRRMKPRNKGSIVNIGSMIAYRGAPLQTPYTGAKYAVRGFTEALRSELMSEQSGVHLAMVHPAGINTPFFEHAGARMEGVPKPPPPVYQPELVAEAVYLAATTSRREVMVGGATVQAAILNKLAPGMLDRAMAWFGVTSQQSHDPAKVARRAPSLYDAPEKASDVRGPWPAFERSAQLAVSKQRGVVIAGAVLAAAALLLPRVRSH